MDVLRISWDALIQYCEQLGMKVKDFKPEIIVGVSRGGLIPARILSDILDIRTIGILGIAFYEKMGETYDYPRIVQELSMDIKGKRILLVDDVADTGRSLEVAKDYLRRKNAGEIKIATLHYKPHSAFKPDYYAMTTTAWIVYPWECHEIERELKKTS